MLFAALLSSTFLILVASNTQSVGRSVDKSGARQRADEGSQTARRLMAVARNADAWQPEAEPSLMGDEQGALDLDELPPAPGDPTYDQYWTPLDKAMGWALTQPYTTGNVAGRLNDLQDIKRNGGRVFIKVPDPRFSREATRYMLESRLLSRGMDEVTDGGDKRWMLRVTSLGMAPKNPEVWARQMLYKSTNFNGATFSYANFVSNYDFDKDGGKGGFASTRLTTDVPSQTATISLAGLNTFGPNVFAPGQLLMLSDGVGDPFSALIARRDANSVTLKAPTPRLFLQANTTASLAATLTSGLDAINDNGAQTALNPNVATMRTLNPVHAEVNAAPNANTDTGTFGNGNFYNLGLKVGERAQFAARPPYARSWGTYSTYSGQNALTVTGPLDRSSANLSFLNAVNTGAPALTPPALDAAQNKYFRLSFTPAGAMQVDKYLPEVDPLVAPRPVTPAVANIEQYKDRAANEGGVLIENDGDFEKIGNVALTDSQLQRLWQRKSFAVASGGNINYTGMAGAIGAGASGARLSWPRPGVDGYAFPMASGSLEQRGIRGWISPWEFLPRGALLELQNNQITLTTDALDDNGNISPNKKVPGTGAYSGIIPVPANGIICAGGNLRVRGNWTGRPLTIVSGHNIYIEGALTGAPGQIALLAKDNVTLNPTQFVQRPQGLTDRHLAATPVPVASQTGGQVTLAPGNVGRFKVGDKVAPLDNSDWGRVTGISGDTLSVAPQLTFSSVLVGGLKLRQMTDPAIAMVDAGGKVTTDGSGVAYAYAIGKDGDSFTRAFLNDGAALNVGVRSAGENIEATITANSGKPNNELHIKTDHNANNAVDTNSSQSNALLREMWLWGAADGKIGNYNEGFFAYDLHASTVANAATTTGDGTATLAQLQSQLATTRFKQQLPAWTLTLPTSSVAPNPYGAVPMRRLAQFQDTGKPSGTQFKVPLTTSVGLFWNSAGGAGNASAPIPDVTYGSFWGAVNAETDQNRTESVDTVKADYYRQSPQFQEMIARPAPNPVAEFSLQRDLKGDPNGLLPRYLFGGCHLEGGDGTTTIAPAYSPRIQATIYAQSGSWFVIPMPAQANAPTLTAASGRWRRSFYKVTVEGTIAQGFTPTAAEDYDGEPDPDGVAVGATKRWLDSLACPTTLNTTDKSVGDWQTISYLARPLPLTNGLALPTTANVLYTYVE